MSTTFIHESATQPSMVIVDGGGKAWNTAGTPALEAAVAANWSDYIIAGAAIDTLNFWLFTIPSTLPAGTYTAYIFDKTNPVASEVSNAQQAVAWSGAKLIGATSLSGAASISQVPIPESRTFRLIRNATGLTGETSIGMQAGESNIFAFDCFADLPVNGRLASFDAISIKSGPAGGITFDSDLDVDKTQAKNKITGVTAGTYVVNIQVTYATASGGDSVEADVTLKVTT